MRIINVMKHIDLEHVARLARLRIKDEELKKLESQIEGILKFVDQLKEVDVKGIEPTSHPLSLSNVFRDDVPQTSFPIEEFMKRAPKSRGRFFEVPKIIENKG